MLSLYIVVVYACIPCYIVCEFLGCTLELLTFEEERDPPAGHDDTLDEIKVTTQNREKKSVLRLKP